MLYVYITNELFIANMKILGESQKIAEAGNLKWQQKKLDRHSYSNSIH